MSISLQTYEHFKRQQEKFVDFQKIKKGKTLANRKGKSQKIWKIGKSTEIEKENKKI